jgi:hypothetical protein
MLRLAFLALALVAGCRAEDASVLPEEPMKGILDISECRGREEEGAGPLTGGRPRNRAVPRGRAGARGVRGTAEAPERAARGRLPVARCRRAGVQAPQQRRGAVQRAAMRCAAPRRPPPRRCRRPPRPGPATPGPNGRAHQPLMRSGRPPTQPSVLPSPLPPSLPPPRSAPQNIDKVLNGAKPGFVEFFAPW